MDYYRIQKSMLPNQRYNHHFQFFVVWILLPILIVVVAATTMRMMVVVRATPFPTVMLDLGNVETTTTTFSPTSATTTTISTSTSTEAVVLTLRDILTDSSTTGFHLAIAPSFFGFFGYFGMVAAWLDDPQQHPYDDQPTSFSSVLDQLPIRSVVGASAGAMVAILLAANVAPINAMTFVICIEYNLGSI
jgi:hypothetical protein